MKHSLFFNVVASPVSELINDEEEESLLWLESLAAASFSFSFASLASRLASRFACNCSFLASFSAAVRAGMLFLCRCGVSDENNDER